MGKGDKKSKKGKIFMGSYGVRRPGKPASKSAVAPTAPEVAPNKEAPKGSMVGKAGEQVRLKAN
ncbi:MAG: 30S ribosomal protein THX [Bacteroidota bacterium]